MKVEIPTSPELAQKISNLFQNKILKPKNMTLVRIDENDGTFHTVHIEWKHGELSDLFFLGYWTKYESLENKKKFALQQH